MRDSTFALLATVGGFAWLGFVFGSLVYAWLWLIVAFPVYVGIVAGERDEREG